MGMRPPASSCIPPPPVLPSNKHIPSRYLLHSVDEILAPASAAFPHPPSALRDVTSAQSRVVSSTRPMSLQHFSTHRSGRKTSDTPSTPPQFVHGQLGALSSTPKEGRSIQQLFANEVALRLQSDPPEEPLRLSTAPTGVGKASRNTRSPVDDGVTAQRTLQMVQTASQQQLLALLREIVRVLLGGLEARRVTSTRAVKNAPQRTSTRRCPASPAAVQEEKPSDRPQDAPRVYHTPSELLQAIVAIFHDVVAQDGGRVASFLAGEVLQKASAAHERASTTLTTPSQGEELAPESAETAVREKPQRANPHVTASLAILQQHLNSLRGELGEALRENAELRREIARLHKKAQHVGPECVCGVHPTE